MHCKRWAGFLGMLLAARSLLAADYDLLIRNGRVIDGTGNPSFHADVAVQGSRVVAVGRLDGDASVVVNAEGLVVAPGFIDVHTHADELEEQPQAENFVRMGVTTVIAGNCGSSVSDVGAYFRRLETTRAALNVATLVGHGTVRGKAMGGSFDRPPTPAELAAMKAHVDQAMKEGAVGLSTGLIYLPGVFAKTDEIVELARVIAPYDGIYTSHMRSEGDQILDALDEVFAVARACRIRAEVSHIKLVGPVNWGRHEAVLAAIERARAEGLDITQDQYLYTASSTGMSQLIPETAREGGKFAERLADPRQKAAIVAEMKAKLKRSQRKDYAYAVIAEYRHDPALNGLSIPEAAKRTRGSASLDRQIELVLELQKNGGASGVFHGIHEGDLQCFLKHPHTMVACDSGLRAFGKGVPHPRGYGNSARLLARYVRELKLLRLEDAIRRMTSLPATTFRLPDRGMIRPGAWADLVVFDPEKVQDNATYAMPHQYVTGFRGVWVNGVAVVDHDRHTGARPGQPLRHNSPAR